MQIDDSGFARALRARQLAAGRPSRRPATAVVGMPCALAATAGLLNVSVRLFVLRFVSSATIAVGCTVADPPARRQTR
jgi:hypothetical protein